MSKIKELSSDVIPKIAAGEVIESPASVIKELIENSLDAGASSISVEISGKFFENIRVTDNGQGMDREDVIKCFLPHTTSKLVGIDDLLSLKTLGFRGEALNSIYSVSDFIIKSRVTSSKNGYEVYAEAGKIIHSSICGMSPGTIVSVSNLFSRIPARRKFLHDINFEYSKILETLIAYSISNPEVRFELSRDGKKSLGLYKAKNLESRLLEVLGNYLYKNLLSYSFSDEHFKIEGFISKPQVASPTQKTQFLFVNGRWVFNKEISKSIREAYANLLEEKVNPPYVLFITINPDLIDVNIHPRKEEIRFWNDSYVTEKIQASIREFLKLQDLTYVKGSFSSNKKSSKHEYLTLKDSKNVWDINSSIRLPEMEEILQVNNTYLVTWVKEGLLIVDQHAAHESILYEEYLKEFEKKSKTGKTYTLEEPVLLHLPKHYSLNLSSVISDFNDLGFQIAEFGEGDWRVTSVPDLLKNHNITNLIMEFISDYIDHNKKPVDEKSKRTMEFLACRSAIKAGDFLSPEQRKNLLKKLYESNSFYTCPHGRPARIILTMSELGKMFKRIK